MPTTPDRSPGPLIEDEEIRLTTPAGSNPSAAGGLVYDPGAGEFKMQDGSGVFNPRSAGTDDKKIKVSATDAVAAFLFSKLMSSDGSVDFAVNTPGGDEKVDVTASLSEIFRGQEMDSDAVFSTSSTVYQDAFLGQSPATLVIDAPGDYYVVFHAQTRLTSNNGEGELALSKNGSVVAGTAVPFSGNQGFTTNTAAHKVTGLSIGDTVGGLYRKTMGAGSVELGQRSIFLVRIGV